MCCGVLPGNQVRQTQATNPENLFITVYNFSLDKEKAPKGA